MLHFFVTRRGSHTFRDYLADWAGEISVRMTLHLYEDFLSWPQPRTGTYVFTDHERLTAAQLDLAVDYVSQLRRDAPGVLVLNDPARVLRRLGLLQGLHRSGINRFRAFPLRDVPGDFRYPGFLRFERDHNGAASGLLRHRDELIKAAVQLLATGVEPAELLAVEFCDTRSPDGSYRKYSYFRVGDEFLPAHIIFSPDWVAKDGASTAEQVVEENRFHAHRPHETWVRDVFATAGIDYGRIDFSLCPDGCPQAWEINTNPVLLYRRENYRERAPLELPQKDLLAAAFRRAWQRLLPESPTVAGQGLRRIELNTAMRHLPR